MSFLHITNITNTPEIFIGDRIEQALNDLDLLSSLDLAQVRDDFFNYIEEMAENVKLTEASAFVDNLLINFDYKEYFQSLYVNN